MLGEICINVLSLKRRANEPGMGDVCVQTMLLIKLMLFLKIQKYTGNMNFLLIDSKNMFQSSELLQRLKEFPLLINVSNVLFSTDKIFLSSEIEGNV